MTDQKLMVRSKYEKYEMLLLWPMQKGPINYVKLTIVLKNQVRLDFRKTQMKGNETSRSTWIEL